MATQHTHNLTNIAAALALVEGVLDACNAGRELGQSVTMGEADWQYAHALGQDRPDREWILSDRDVWYRNPAYRGPLTPHPEDCLYDEEEYDAVVFALNFVGPRQQTPVDLDAWSEDIPW